MDLHVSFHKSKCSADLKLFSDVADVCTQLRSTEIVTLMYPAEDTLTRTVLCSMYLEGMASLV